MKLYVHPSIEKQLSAIRATIPQAILLTGEIGIGLKTLALDVSKEYEIQSIVQPELLTKTSSIPAIGIDVVRALYISTRTKSSVSSVVIIDDVEKMTREAQNSFLKLLEEPNNSTHFVLTSHHPEFLLPTVRSRVQSLHVPYITSQQSKTLIDDIGSVDISKLRQLLFVADGRPAEMTRLLASETHFSRTVDTMVVSKKLIEATPYERIQIIMTLKTDKLYVFEVLRRSIELLTRTPTKESLHLIERLFTAQEAITRNGNVRLHLMNAVV